LAAEAEANGGHPEAGFQAPGAGRPAAAGEQRGTAGRRFVYLCPSGCGKKLPSRSHLLPLCVSQAVLKQFGGGYADSVFADEGEAQQHTKLEKLYISTRAAKVRQTNNGRFPPHFLVLCPPPSFLLEMFSLFASLTALPKGHSSRGRGVHRHRLQASRNRYCSCGNFELCV
jgi:hypothetical protein